MSTVYMDQNSILRTTPNVDSHSKSTPPIVPIEHGILNEDMFNDANKSTDIDRLIKTTAMGTAKMLTSSNKKYTEEDREKINKMIEQEYPNMVKRLAGNSAIVIVERTNKIVQMIINKYDYYRPRRC